MIRSFRFVSIGLLTLVAVSAGCGAAPLSPTEVRTLSNAERLWAARSFQDYVFELRRSCFCPVEFFQWSRIEVVGGRVTRVTVIETGADLPPAFWSGFPTVEQIFERIRSSAA